MEIALIVLITFTVAIAIALGGLIAPHIVIPTLAVGGAFVFIAVAVGIRQAILTFIIIGLILMAPYLRERTGEEYTKLQAYISETR